MMTPQTEQAILNILALIGGAAGALQPVITQTAGTQAGQIDAAAAVLIQIAQGALSAHIALTGKPIDLDLLHPVEFIP